MKPLTSQALLIVLALGSFAIAAHAAPLVVFERPINDRYQEVSAKFAVDRERGRAWIDVTVTNVSRGDEARSEQVTKEEVDGLYYDPVRKQVLYRTPSGPLVCAEDGHILWDTYLKTTGQCLLNARTEQRKVDDGFNVREQTVAEVSFDVSPR